MPFIDTSYFDDDIPLVVVGNEDAINNKIVSCEPNYLRAVMGESLYEAFVTGIAVGSGYSSGYSSGYGGSGASAVADRWKWIRDGYVFTDGTVKRRWPGLQNTEKKSPLANYTYWYYLRAKNPSASGTGGFTTVKMENANVASPYVPAMRAWNDMVEWNSILYKMLHLADTTTGDLIYPEFVRAELSYSRESVNVYNRQQLF